MRNYLVILLLTVLLPLSISQNYPPTFKSKVINFFQKGIHSWVIGHHRHSTCSSICELCVGKRFWSKVFMTKTFWPGRGVIGPGFENISLYRSHSHYSATPPLLGGIYGGKGGRKGFERTFVTAQWNFTGVYPGLVQEQQQQQQQQQQVENNRNWNVQRTTHRLRHPFETEIWKN